MYIGGHLAGTQQVSIIVIQKIEPTFGLYAPLSEPALTFKYCTLKESS
jgi:hypothetical protein